jgi:hypothetical protein
MIMNKLHPAFYVLLVVLFTAGLFFLSYQKSINNGEFAKNNKISFTTDFYSIEASYPRESWDKNGVMKQMVDYMVNQKKEEWKIGSETYNAEQKIAKDFPDRPKMKYELNISYVATSSPKMKTRSYVFSVYEFTGGAHGNTAITSFNFSKDSQLKVEDVIDFSQGNYVSLAKVLKTKLLKSLEENTNESMVNDGLGLNFLKADGTFDKEKCNCDGYYFPSNVQVFTIHDDGIKFIFAQYQVAPYAVGTPSVMLTWSELEKFINKDNYLAKQKK